ncbi:MAG: hypothetical protein R3255_11305, partial [Candidatus Lokiarchaeia archaeon]|nr:hypothetical protein [Candidatus Lokiarchaeia archaeon]
MDNQLILKIIQGSLLLILIFLWTNLNFSQDADSLVNRGKLTVIIKGFESDAGNCRFALDDSKEVYESEDSVWIGKELPI